MKISNLQSHHIKLIGGQMYLAHNTVMIFFLKFLKVFWQTHVYTQ